MLEAPAALVAGEAFNIGTDEQNYLVRALAEILAEVTGCEVAFAGDASPDPRSYRVDFSTFARAFPYRDFDWDAKRGTEELIAAYGRSGHQRGLRRVLVRSASPAPPLLDEHRLDCDLRWVAH